ncbi:hypothetical protein IE53DRAFT_312589, partial [Violaceomyces palustris]
MLWFINSRRRSGWTTMFRTYANKEKNRMVEIVEALRREDNGQTDGGKPLEAILTQFGGGSISAKQKADKCRQEWKKTCDWIRVGVKDRVGDWMREVV